MKKIIWNHFIQGFVIFSSVLVSLYLGNLNNNSTETNKKNNYIKDLSSSLKEDISQLQSLINILNESENLIVEIQNDLDNVNFNLNEDKIINNILNIEVGFSFFPQDGVYNQMISTGSFELITNEDLKKNLLEMYNHQMARNYATSLEIDNFNLTFRAIPYEQFRIRFDYNLLDGDFYGKRKLTSYNFNDAYYKSGSFYGLLSQAKLYANMYRRQLSDILVSYEETILLCRQEVM